MTGYLSERQGAFSSRPRWRSIVSTIAATVVLGPRLLSGQGSPGSEQQVQEGPRIFALKCAGCHGPDAHGTDQGPALTGQPELRKRSISWLHALIRNGIPSSGMPAFDLPSSQIDALATLVHSLNSPAAEQIVPGDQAAGERLFFGEGQCSTCHMVHGRGEPIGPDLSGIARDLTVDELRTSLLQPSAHIARGYEIITVQLRNGQSVRGFSRSRSNSEIVVQDLTGQFHLLSSSEVSAITEEKKSPMPPVKASPNEVQNLVAYLSGLTGVKPGPIKVKQPSGASGIPFARILHPRAGDWLTYNGVLSGNRYSELTGINTTNAGKLGLTWIFSVPLWKQLLPDTSYFVQNMEYFGLEVTPIVADGIMYTTGPNQVFALDARTGHEIWEFSRPRPAGLVGDAALGTNRGLAILGSNLFMATDDAHLIALNRITGSLVWEVVMPDQPMHYGSTVAPLVVKNAVIAGVSGADWGVRGFVAGYEAASGERLWRYWTVPGKGETGAETWGGNPREDGGGSTWSTGSYDPETDTLYWSTGNPFPDSDDSTRPGDNLYTNCILALNPDTGTLKWFYQTTPHDIHDWDANAPLVLVDTKYHGLDRKLLLHANKNGFFYVFDRNNGHLLLAKNFVRTTWARGVGSDGRPELSPENGILCPDIGTNWNASAFSPITHLYYLMAFEKCDVELSAGNWKAGQPQIYPGRKYLRALDIETGKIVWELPQLGPGDGKREAGVLATAGGILLYGDPSGDIVAVNQRNGEKLWHFTTNGENKASPMTYMVGDKQFIALAVGPNILCFSLP
jgi:PQQ-dependent dehydrogenase (methanol/ethanol family)